ncbi:MAG: type II secretion system minor pseudopilin GspI [Parvularculaceae bacterium]|nr:type II secretion system minor pseudopilin GspI [Parvularculaceae bacterium]
MAKPAQQMGLTLIEVLVALAVLSAVIGSLLVLLSQQTRQASYLEDRMLARIVAENALTDFMAAKQTNREADLAGEVELSGREYFYSVDRSPANLEGFETVTTEVRLGRNGQVVATLSTLRPGSGR